jgi:hypothetical protein
MAALPTIDPAALTAAYEALRARAVGDPIVGRPTQGLALLYRRGLPAWLAQVSQAAATTTAAPSPAADRPVTTTVTSAEHAAEAVLVVASMVLASRAGEQP